MSSNGNGARPQETNSPVLSSRTKAERRRQQKLESLHRRRANGGKSPRSPEEIRARTWLDHWKIKPGEIRNPHPGRLPPITTRAREELEKPLPEKLRIELGLAPGATVGDGIVRRLVITALQGSGKDAIAASIELTDRAEGKAITRVAGPLGEGLIPPTLQVNFVKRRTDESV